MFATGPRAVGFTIVWPEGVIFRSMMTYHAQFLLLVVAGWVNCQQQDVIDYLQEENRVLRAGLRGKRLKLSDDERRQRRARRAERASFSVFVSNPDFRVPRLRQRGEAGPLTGPCGVGKEAHPRGLPGPHAGRTTSRDERRDV